MEQAERPLPRDDEQLKLARSLSPDQRLLQLEQLVEEMRLIREAFLATRRRHAVKA